MIMKGELMKKLRIYIDTSVVGGCHDEEFSVQSRGLLRMARSRKILLLVSQVLIDELKLAPQVVQDELKQLPAWATEMLPVTPEVVDLRDAYLDADVVGRNHSNDALHVAQATVANADIIVSWNFKHIVHFDKIRGFNAVNLREGYLPIEIRSPMEIV
jgi:predicted nucleic acid-binding protein